jgi:DNA modification methylase
MIGYHEFLEKRRFLPNDCGFDVEENALNKNMFKFQKSVTRKALKSGRYAIFADCGLGKTIMQMEWANMVSIKTKAPVLILTPLAVSKQTINEGIKFGINISNCKEYSRGKTGIFISNYEQIDNIPYEEFSGIVLDESSILKNFTGVYRNKLTEYFKNTQYRLCCTATPSPNDMNEIGNHSEFLGILDATDMRSKWFVRDEGMNNYRLKGHAEESFYSWISSWACMFSKPSDIGFSDDGYALPKLNIIQEIIETPKQDNGLLFNTTAVSATDFHKELRLSIDERLRRVCEIVNNSRESFIVWITQNIEGDILKKMIPDAIEVRGNHTNEFKENKLIGFSNGEFRVLITKKKIAQFGLNFQTCHNQVHTSLDFSFEALYQTIRRSYRFGQKSSVNIYCIVTDTMQNVLDAINTKQSSFNKMKEKMNKMETSISYGLKNEYERREAKTANSHIINGDSCIEIDAFKDNSIDLIVYSPPFSSLFTYSNYIHDMGNADSHEEFFEHYSFLLKKMYRKLKPGRLMCCHTKDLAVYKNSSGYTGLYNFTGDHHNHVEKEGFKYVSKICIWTDPVLEMQRTKTQRLLYKQVTTDSTYSGVGIPEYVTIFRKWEGNESEWVDVKSVTKENFPLDTWQKWASPIWMDIMRTDVLNGREGKSQGDEKHIAPLQLEVIKRLVYLYSNKGETVFTPFLGIGSEVYTAIKCGRKGIGIELKPSYFDVAVSNIRSAEECFLQQDLFKI